MGDLNGRRGRVQGTETGNDGESIVVAMVPTSEILRYAIDLRSMTGGRGRFRAEHDHYDPLPQNLLGVGDVTPFVSSPQYVHRGGSPGRGREGLVRGIRTGPSTCRVPSELPLQWAPGVRESSVSL